MSTSENSEYLDESQYFSTSPFDFHEEEEVVSSKTVRELFATVFRNPDQREASANSLIYRLGEILTLNRDQKQKKDTEQNTVINKLIFRLIVRYSHENPFKEIAKPFKVFLDKIIPLINFYNFDPPLRSIFISSKGFPRMQDIQDAKVLGHLQKEFEVDGKISNISRIMSFHPIFFNSFRRTYNQVMYASDGPLPPHMRHYLAMLAASRHRCEYLLEQQLQRFYDSGGPKNWVKKGFFKGCKSEQVRGIYNYNVRLCHSPWSITKDHIEELVTKYNWNIQEIIHATIILSTFHSLCGVVYGMGLCPENSHLFEDDKELKNILYPIDEKKNGRPERRSSTPLPSPSNNNNNDRNSDLLEQLRHESEEDVVGHSDGGQSEDELSEAIVKNINIEIAPQGGGFMSHFHQKFSGGSYYTHRQKNRFEDDNNDSSDYEEEEGEGIFDDPLYKDPLLAKHIRSYSLKRTSEEDLEEIKEEEEEEEENMKGNRYNGRFLTKRFKDDRVEYIDFNSHSTRIKRIFHFGFNKHASSVISSYYSKEVADCLGKEFDNVFAMTYERLYNIKVDTYKLRRAIWYYIDLVLGLQHDDYSYSNINKYLKINFKKYMKFVSCYPEKIDKQIYKQMGITLDDIEKCHVCLLIITARKKASLIHACRAIENWSTSSSSRE